MRLSTLVLLSFFFVSSLHSQISNFKDKFTLPNEIAETSGLIFFNESIITHNDSGNDPKLYEIDSLSGSIKRVITIANATNVDWEDITQSATHIFVGDIGNNLGNRQDLKIYKIDKSDFLSSTTVNAEVISFSYEDQNDFSENLNNHDFDAEAITVFDNQLLLFSKNWLSEGTKVYSIPLDAGTYVASKVSSFQNSGLITGVTYNEGDDSFFMSGYSKTLVPFLLYVSQNRAPGVDIFNSGATHIDLTGLLEQGSQIEGITYFDGARYYLSRELLSTMVNGIPFVFFQKLYEFESDLFFLLATQDEKLALKIILFPNPVNHNVKIENNSNHRITEFSIFNSSGKQLIKTKRFESISWETFDEGVLFVKILLSNDAYVVKRLIRE